MNRTRKFRLVSLFLCAILMTAMTLSITGCDAQPKDTGNTAARTVSFTLTVTDKDGNAETFTVKTDKSTVGDALLAEGLIEGDYGAYGLYVKTVNGITADYDTDGTYWAFYVDGEYALKGVDKTPVTANAVYEFKVEA